MADLPHRIALVYDRVTKWGGAEQVLLALHDIFPTAPLYTTIYNKSKAAWAQVFPQVIPSFLQHSPLIRNNYELFPWLTPLAAESFNFGSYDAVISVTSADCKGILTQPQTFHLCYCLTPTRYLYTHPVIPWPISNYLKYWDSLASRRPDAYVAISQTVKARIQSIYNLDSQVVYPPVNIDNFAPGLQSDYFLSVTRLVYHKQPDVLTRLFNKLNLPLVIAGTGQMESRLRRLANSNVRLTGWVSDKELISLYRNAKAYVSVHEEDFGLAYVEAQASGLPILALNRGGVGELVSHKITGYLAQDIPDLTTALSDFSVQSYRASEILESSRKFSKSRFQEEFAKVFTQEWKKYKNTYMY